MKWPLVRVGEIATQHRGVSYSKEDSRDQPTDGYTPIFRANNITESGLTFEDLVYVPNSRVSQVQHVREGDIVLAASSGSLDVVGKAAQALQNEEIAFGAFCKLVRPTRRVHPRFLGHFFKTKKYRQTVSSLAEGANINNLRNEHINNLELVLPSIEEQRRIAAILDRAEALRAKRRQALAKLDTLTQSLFLQMFGDHERMTSKSQLNELLLEGDGINYGVVQPGDEYPDGKPLIRVGDFHNGGISTKAIKRIDPVIESGYKRSRLRGGEILVSCVGSIGAVAMATPELSGSNIARAVARIPLDREKIHPLYLESYLRTPFVQRYFVSELRTVTQPTLNIKQISETLVYVPSRELQDKFALRLTAFRSLATSQVASQDKIARIFSSLQHRGFRGEL